MTTQELISKLKTLPPEATVEVLDRYSDWDTDFSVEVYLGGSRGPLVRLEV